MKESFNIIRTNIKLLKKTAAKTYEKMKKQIKKENKNEMASDRPSFITYQSS